MKVILFFWHAPRNIAVLCIQVYQLLLSPDHSFWAKYINPQGYCKFHPSCSMYGAEAFKKYGFIRGSVKTMWRILRCNPWNKGGIDHP